MHKHSLTLPIIFSLCVGVANASEVATDTNLQTEQDKISYSVGVDLGHKFAEQKITVEPEVFLQGFKDGMFGNNPVLSEQEMTNTLVNFQKQLAEQHSREFQKMSDENSKAGEEFLAANKAKEGVVTLPSGLQYKVVNNGDTTKETPVAGDMVTTHYRGTFIDGTEFDSSYSRGKPATFPVDGVIPGWSEALQLMHPGAHWQLVIPSNLAYGAHGAGSRIGPNQTLLFDIELLSVDKQG